MIISKYYLRRISFVVALLALSSCTTYQAPVTDEGTVVQRREVPIFSSSGATTSSPAQTTPSTAGSPAVTTGAATVAVAPARSGIGRTTIGREPVQQNAPTGSSSSLPAPATESVVQPRPSTPATVPAATPAATSNTTSGTASSATTHVVQRGETLYSIAFQHDLDYRRLALANNLTPPYTIYPNQRLTLSQSGISDNAVSGVPVIPPSPAGESAPPAAQRPQTAAENRRQGNVATRQVDGIVWQWPVLGQVLRTFDTNSASGRGVDIAARQGEPVYAAADGEVVFAGRGIQGAGDLIILRHGARLLTAYMHNSSMLVNEGASISAGDKIAEVGANASGQEMLHFEVRLDGKPVDPLTYLPAR